MNNLPIGAIFCYPSPICPDGFLPCDGRELSKKEYPELYALIKDTWGETVSTFFLPDLRGLFVRGYDEEGNIDPERKLGTIQDDALQGHGHVSSCSSNGSHDHSIKYLGEGLNHANTFYTEFWVMRSLNDKSGYKDQRYGKTDLQGAHAHSISVDNPKDSAFGRVRIATETRPKNISLMYCIKVKP